MITSHVRLLPDTVVGECRCCGQPAIVLGPPTPPYARWRCTRHSDRNPCAIEGCTRTTAARGQLDTDAWLCPVHWRRYIPPRSRVRRAYHALYRKGSRLDWPDELRVQWWRLWSAILRRARRRATEGFLDVEKIHELFGGPDE